MLLVRSCLRRYVSLGGIMTEEIKSPHVKYQQMATKLQTGILKEIRVLQIRLLKCQTGLEKRRLFSVAIAAGNGDGGIGFGLGRDRSTLDAMLKAVRNAEQAMSHYDLHGKTLFHDDRIVFRATTLIVRPMPSGFGVRAHWAIQEICRVAGIADLSAKVYGSRTAINVVLAFLLALSRQKSPEAVARDSGMRVADVVSIYRTGIQLLK